MNNANLSGTAALVTGAASGLGRATALRLQEAGAHVIGMDLRASEPTPYELVLGDISDTEVVKTALGAVAATGAPLRAVVNCAGVRSSMPVISVDGPHSLEEFRRVLEVNLVGTFNVTRLAADFMAKQIADDDGVRGAIVNTASIAAYEGLPNQAAYTASKAAIAGLTLQLARDLAPHGIRVNAIAPGVMETPILSGLTPARREALHADVILPKRLGRPEEFAELTLSILSNVYMNGAVVRIDGALRMSRG